MYWATSGFTKTTFSNLLNNIYSKYLKKRIILNEMGHLNKWMKNLFSKSSSVFTIRLWGCIYPYSNTKPIIVSFSHCPSSRSLKSDFRTKQSWKLNTTSSAIFALDNTLLTADSYVSLLKDYIWNIWNHNNRACFWI